MYEIKLDLGHENNACTNPLFICKDWDEFIKMITFFFDNGYDVYIRESEDAGKL